MVETKKGFKIVNHELQSAVIEGYPCIQYKLGEFVYPNVNTGPATVFESLDRAIGFLIPFGIKYPVFECEYVPSDLNYVWGVLFHPLSHVDDKDTKMKSIFRLPVGTVLAISVKLTKLVIDQEFRRYNNDNKNNLNLVP